jgi:hypothetical protein
MEIPAYKQKLYQELFKALSHQTALSLRLQGVVKFNKAARDRNEKCDIFDDMKTSQRPHGDHGDATELPRRFN